MSGNPFLRDLLQSYKILIKMIVIRAKRTLRARVATKKSLVARKVLKYMFFFKNQLENGTLVSFLNMYIV